MKAATVFILGLIVGVALASNPLVIIGDNEKHVLDASSLATHMNQKQELKCFVVDTSSQGGDLVQTVKKILQSANITQSQIDSFLVSTKDFKQNITPILKTLEQVSAEQLIKILSEKPEAVVYFRNHAAEARLLQETNTNSKLFTNMTPSVLSGLFVALFLIIMLIIGIGCLYDIKTNDKFARNPLWVGKES